MTQPKTENVEFKMRDDGLYELTSITNGASIGYQIEDKIGTNSWVISQTYIAGGQTKNCCEGHKNRI